MNFAFFDISEISMLYNKTQGGELFESWNHNKILNRAGNIIITADTDSFDTPDPLHSLVEQ